MKIKLLHPLISCICITNNRPEMLLKSIRSFDMQNYPNTELIISYPKKDSITKALINKLSKTENIKIIAIERLDEESIGTARNNAVKICNGVYVCMWDDDDIYYYTRIADQYNLLQGSGKYFQSSLLSQIILFDATVNKAYLSSPYHWNGSLLCKRDHLLEYPCSDTNHFECNPVINYLASKNLLLQTGFNPQLYVHVYHTRNIIDYFHFQYLTRQGDILDSAISQNICKYLEQKLMLS